MTARITALATACTLLLTAATVAQTVDARRRADDRAIAAVIAQSPHVIGNVLDVKLREGCGAELVDGRLRSRTGHDLEVVQALFDEAVASPLFTALPWDELDRLHRRACSNLPAGRGPGHLGLWFRLELMTTAAADRLAARLWQLDLVEHVVNEVHPTPASAGRSASLSMPHDIPPPTPLFTNLQQTHLPTPLGHGIWRSQGVLGARGQGIQARFVEGEFHVDHEDVHDLVAANFIGALPPPGPSANHGLAGSSIVVADRNEYGITGVADEADALFASFLSHGGFANALLAAGATAGPGDVVMMVMMFLLGQTGPTDWVPIEFLQPEFDATLTLTGNGLLVVATAANGDNSLDDPRFLNRFDRSFRDSGAIFVSATDSGAMGKAWFANYGSRVDANSWGDDVCACGIGTLFYPNLDIRQAYTAAYAGTSPAVPTVTGIVLALQGAAERQLGQRLTNAEVLQLLWTHGPMSPDPIGRRPDLEAMLRTIGAIDGLELSEPDLAIGSSAILTLTGPSGSGAFLFANFATADLNLGFNRSIHLALPAITIGFLPLPAGTATFQIDIPNAAGLHGLSLYLQAGVLSSALPVHVTNSGQLTVR